MDIQEVKDRLMITTTKYDTYLAAIVPDIVEFAKDYCNQAFVDDTGAEALPGPAKTFVAKAAQYFMSQAGVNSRSAPGTSISYEQDIPKSLKGLLKSYRKVFK